MRRLVCACVVRKTLKTGFLALRPISSLDPLYRQVVGIPICTCCSPLDADLFLICYESDFMMPLSDDKQADINDAFITTSR